MQSILGASGTLLSKFKDVRDIEEFLISNNIVWDQRSDLEYIQTHSVDVDHLLFVYRKYIAALERCVEIAVENLSASDSSEEGTERCQSDG
jgi:hypothetical protein